MFLAPQTPDGRIVKAEPSPGGGLRIVIRFRMNPQTRDLVRGREAHLVFASRSRLARLGINVLPVSELAWEGQALHLEAEVRALVKAYGVAPLMADVLQPGVRVGRLVLCDPARRLSSEEIDQAVLANELQLPGSYSIDFDGRFRIRPEGRVYDLAERLTPASLRTIVSRADGKDQLNRIQLPRAVDRIVLEPQDGVITSCSMFLHQHFVVLESAAGPLGRHLQAVVLDPVRTRGTNVFLEFANESERRIVNPTVSAAMYRADDVRGEPPRLFAISGGGSAAPDDYAVLSQTFDRLEEGVVGDRYSHRLVALTDDFDALLAGGAPRAIWRHPGGAVPLAGADISAREMHAVSRNDSRTCYGTALLTDVPTGAQVTLLLGYFPNLIEHTQICAAALENKVARIVFRRASYEHGSFLSARDHGRLADYDTLGVDVLWCNDERRHVATHVFRGLRGYFMEPKYVDRFHSALIFAAYGSAKELSAEERDKVRRLLANLRALFGEDIAIMTGGGPGAMQQATELGQEMGMLVGASFIETVDQKTNQTASFYQTFQGRSRQARQRWFEVASFHLFFMGGVGTLEEVGLTLTDMKLGVIDLSPLVFFGRHDGTRYWSRLQEQFQVMVEAGRAPAWLTANTFVTDDPDQVAGFYKRILELG
jgi:predicted Rossmann-fold nucleotide-binding protein